MKQHINTITIIVLMVFLGCSKKDTTPNTNNITNTTVVNAKWLKNNYYVQYAADGVTESYRGEFTYDTEGRPIGYVTYTNGVLSQKYRDYTYNGDECIYYYDFYTTSGTLSSTTKVKVGYKNN